MVEDAATVGTFKRAAKEEIEIEQKRIKEQNEGNQKSSLASGIIKIPSVLSEKSDAQVVKTPVETPINATSEIEATTEIPSYETTTETNTPAMELSTPITKTPITETRTKTVTETATKKLVDELLAKNPTENPVETSIKAQALSMKVTDETTGLNENKVLDQNLERVEARSSLNDNSDSQDREKEKVKEEKELLEANQNMEEVDITTVSALQTLKSVQNRLVIGAKLRVKWDILDEETNECKANWFPGILAAFLKEEETSSGKCRTYRLDYGQHGEFPPCQREVTFNHKGDLWDHEDCENLDWAFEGEEPHDDNDDDATISLHDVISYQNELDEECGSVLEAGMTAFKTLPHDKQLSLAQGYRSFADAVKDRLKDLQIVNGVDYVITSEEISNIIADVVKSK